MTKPNLERFANYESQGNEIKVFARQEDGIMDDIRRRYADLYRRLKAEAVSAIERIEAPDNVKQELVKRVSSLPHPAVASLLDIREVCSECVSDKLEWLYKYFGNEAKGILGDISELSDIEELEISAPPRPERWNIEDVGEMLAWTNEIQLYQLRLLAATRRAADITLKGRCPTCGSDLMIVIAKDKELRLRCRNPSCKKEWLIQDVS